MNVVKRELDGALESRMLCVPQQQHLAVLAAFCDPPDVFVRSVTTMHRFVLCEWEGKNVSNLGK